MAPHSADDRFDTVPCAVLPAPGTALLAIRQTTPPAELTAALRQRLAGALVLNPGWDGVMTLEDADHHHWIHVSADEIVSFQSFLTPYLRTTLQGPDKTDRDAVSETISRPERLAAHLSQARLQNDTAAVTGHLIGAELSAARPYWLGQQVAMVIGSMSPYLDALRFQGVAPLWIDPKAADDAGERAVQSAVGG